MKFCEKCGAMMMPNKQSDGSIIDICSCGHSQAGEKNQVLGVKIKKKDVETVTIPAQDGDERLPQCDMECEKCGHTRCYYWEIQTHASDEPPTRFYKCVACKHTWREYS